MSKKFKVLKQVTAIILCITLLTSQITITNAQDLESFEEQNGMEINVQSAEDDFSDETSGTSSKVPDSFDGSSETDTDVSEDTDKFGDSEEETFSDADESKESEKNSTDTSDEEIESYYSEGRICIYNYSQLLLIGTDTQVFTGDKDGNIGEGNPVSVSGNPLVYGANASYYLMNDISMDYSDIWDFPDGFSGSFSSGNGRTGNTVYDSQTDTIYIYNRYQLALLKSENAGEEPVMSEDYQAEKVGMGQVFTLGDDSYLTYGNEHNYVIASTFSAGTPELLSNTAIATETTQDISTAYPSDYEGRNYFGQVVKKIGDKEYILIGNEAQLRAIGTNIAVTEPIWRVYETRAKKAVGYTEWAPSEDDGEYKTELYYPGDADVVKFDDTYDWSGTALYGDKTGDHKLNDTEYLDVGKLDVTGIQALKRYVYVSSTLQDSPQMTVVSAENEDNSSETSDIAETGSDDADSEEDEEKTDFVSDDTESSEEEEADKTDDATLEDTETDFTDDVEETAEFSSDAATASVDVDEEKTYALTYDVSAHSNANIAGSGYRYSKDANYIIFRDIDLSKDGINSNKEDDDWTPINNFQGNMEGRKGLTEGQNVTISNVNINQEDAIDQSGNSNNSSNTEYGVGFFRSLSTPYDSKLQIATEPVVVKNITLSNVKVSTTTTSIKKDFSLIGTLLTPVLALLGLSSGLKDDPKSFSTGAFAGVIKGNVQITGCHVENISGVSNVNNWTGGFVGYISGVTKYDALSGLLGTITDALSTLLNLIPLLGLGDLITILLNGGVLKVENLIPIGYVNPVITDCSITGNDQVSGQDYTGGFAGESIGAVMNNCYVGESGDLVSVSGTDYSGGFVGRASNAVVVGLLSSLGIEVMGNFPVNTIMLKCKIGGNLSVSALGSNGKESGYAGGFIGEMRNSYAVDCCITNLNTVAGKDYVGGFAGMATLGDVADINESQGLLVIVKNLLTGILNGSFSNMDILNLVGLRPSVVTGCTITGDTISVIASGENAGGLVGYAGAVQISDTSELTDETKSTTTAIKRMLTKTGVAYEFENHSNSVAAETSVNISAAESAGGILGFAKMTSVSDVLGGTVTAADYMRFELKNTSADGGLNGLTITASGEDISYAGGAIGQGTGGEVRKITITNLKSVSAKKGAGGFAGYFGSGTLANVGGINLLGLKLLKIDGLLSVGQMIETFTVDSKVSGISSGFTVSTSAESGKSGGFIGECVSGRATNTEISNLREVTASETSGKAGGFAGFAKAGDALANAGESVTSSGLPAGIELENLLGVVSALRPEFNNTSIEYLSNGDAPQITADMAGGFIGDGQAVDVNYGNNNSGLEAESDDDDSDFTDTAEETSTDSFSDDSVEEFTEADSGEEEFDSAEVYGTEAENETNTNKTSTTISGLSYIKGSSYAGGFAGRLMPGDVAQTGSVKLLGLLNVTQLLSVMDVAYPRISDSGFAGNDLTVIATGKNSDVALGDAGGYIGNGKAVIIKDSDVTDVKEIKASYHAGGYIGMMRSGSAVEAGDATGDLLNSVLGKILNLKELASVLQAASSKITDCKVSGISDGMTVIAESGLENAEGYAGGYAGEMQSGHVNNSENVSESGKGVAVENLLKVEGLRYAGGFGGLVKAGSVAEIGSKSAILNKVVDLTGLLSLVNAFVPVIQNAGVQSVADGLTVEVTGTLEKDTTNDSDAGSAGGFIGCATGVQISNCDVDKLKHTSVSEPKNLQQEDGSSYYGKDSSYAVSGYRYAGGYFGKAAMGSTASIGGASVLDKVLSASNLASVLTVVASVIENSDVYGATGGFNILSSDEDGDTGKAGGFAGLLLGVQIQASNSYNFAHIIGRESAGGYVGTMEPGSAADVVGSVSVLGGLVSADNLLGVLQAFVPTIKNSETTCIPCGGAVRAQAQSSDGVYRGLAGGYAGYNYGGQIWGNNSDNWKGSAYTGTQQECAAYRIRSVYGTEYAGGFTGLMRCANVADTGSLKVLFGLIKLDNPLTLLQAVYPTEKNTAVYGPLRGLDVDTWNKWVSAVGSYGSYGDKLQKLGEVLVQNELDGIISRYAYGYAVTAGRSILASEAVQGGSAGGYVGRMEGGTITNAHAKDIQSVEALRSSGGFAGEMLTGAVANTGDISLAGLKVAGTDSLSALNTFVPAVKQSYSEGYQSGARIKATGISDNDPAGMAGGFVGRMIGGQIWGNENTTCKITNLRRVDGTSYVGGFAGKIDSGSAVAIDTASKQGLLNKLLDALMVNAPTEIIKVLGATVSTVRYAETDAWNDWGIIINGTYKNGNNTGYAKAAGGFAGSICGAVLGKKDTAESGVSAQKIRSVISGEYAGGYFGVADVSGAAQISTEGETSVVKYLLQLGRTDVLDAFRTYIYYGSVSGSPDAGLSVSANTAVKSGQNNEVTYTGTAGGFGGSLLNGSVKNSSVTKLNCVTGLNSVGGFIGYSGKSGVVGVDKLDVLGNNSGQLLGGALGVLDVFGSHIDDSAVTGVDGGYTVQSKEGEEQIAGGFIGYANLARISGCEAGKNGSQTEGLKQVASGSTAGGFAGRTSFAYLADVKLDSTLVDALVTVLNQLVKALYLDKIQDSDLLHINLGIIKVDALYDGNLLHVNLLGLDVSVGLSKASADNEQQTDFAVITIGDSSIKLPCSKDGILTTDDDTKSNISISLIKANRTKIENCSVWGIGDGYDVYAGGAGNDTDGTDKDGRSGGFVGYNDEGLLQNNNMFYCDVVRGTPELVGPFSGKSDLDSVYEFNTKKNIEGDSNIYRIYRKITTVFDEIKKNSDTLNCMFATENGWSVFSVEHMQNVESYDTLKDAVITKEGSSTYADLNAYMSDAKAVLMSDAPTTLNTSDSTTPEPSDVQDPCDEFINLTVNKVWKDFRNMDGIRPDKITVTLSRSWTDADGIQQTETVPGYENYEISGDTSKSTWQEIIEELPAYIRDDEGNTHYYTYSVTETEVTGYTTVISTSDDGFTFTVTNRHFALLPDTGGKGIMIFILAGGLLLVLMLYTGYRRKRKQAGMERRA